MKTAHKKIELLQKHLKNKGIDLSYFDVKALILAEMQLHRWCELECGDGDNYCSWAIERDETTDVPYMVKYYHNTNKPSKTRVADREKGALKRIEKILKCDDKFKYYYFYQSDPRGCALFVSAEPMTQSNYSSIGYAVCSYN